MAKETAIVHHGDRRTDVVMPYAPGIVVRRGQLLFLSGVTAAPVYHSHPHRDEEFDLPRSMREQALLAMDNLQKTLAAAGARLQDLVAVTRYLTDVAEQDDLNRVWATYLGGHLPTTTTVEVSRLATHANCKIEITAIAVVDTEAGQRMARAQAKARRSVPAPASRGATPRGPRSRGRRPRRRRAG